MAPRSKRARSDSGSTLGNLQTNPSSSDKQPDLKQLEPYEKLWFDDASIVLATDVHLYRVHKGILANYSSVFKDMLEMPTGEAGDDGGGSIDSNHWDGLPLVRMAGDSDENVSQLLMTLYNRDFYDGYKPTKFSIIASLLSMSTKYDIPIIRTQVIKHLERFYPFSLSEVFQLPDGRLYDEYESDEYHFQLLAISQQCNIRRLLPMLFYKCAACSLPTILSAPDNLDKQTLQKVLIGREKLLTLSYDFGVRALFPSDECADIMCFKGRRYLIEAWTNVDGIMRKLPIEAVLDGLTEMTKTHSFACEECFAKSAEARELFKIRFWEDLPCIFGLGSRDEIIAELEE